ncbi:MAG: DUF1840 domain-containing protein [Rhodocyclaceae bacterium]|nr:DUF1840 domain-containing protein [Rhodocyclaceae bacterium]
MKKGLVVFKSQATADVIYFADVAQRLLEIVGKEANAAGILTVAELPAAIARLEAAIAADRDAHRRLHALDAPADEAADGGEQPRVSLTQRALPFLAMLKEALANEKPVVWGV